MFERGRSFDGWDIIFFVVFAFGGAMAVGLSSQADYVPQAGFGFGAVGLALRRGLVGLLPRREAELPLASPVTTGRTLLGAVGLGVGLVVTILTGLALVGIICGVVSTRDPRGLLALGFVGLIFAGGVVLLRYSLRAGRG
jgi:hypothetical protein